MTIDTTSLYVVILTLHKIRVCCAKESLESVVFKYSYVQGIFVSKEQHLISFPNETNHGTYAHA